jgi:hypothetical protein
MTGGSPTPPYSIGALEGASVAFLGAFAGGLGGTAYATQGFSTVTVIGGLLSGVVAFAAYLGYHSYQNS